MGRLEVHEYVRIFLPGLFLVFLIDQFWPDTVPDNTAHLAFIAVMVGLFYWPITDRISSYFYGLYAAKFDMPNRIIDLFSKAQNIVINKENKAKVYIFYREYEIPDDCQAKKIVEAYKMFSRSGLGGTHPEYRIRMEKSFGILYFSLFITLCLLILALILQEITDLIPKNNHIFNCWKVDLFFSIAAAIMAFLESKLRFEISFKNELLVLNAHIPRLKRYYDVAVLADASSPHSGFVSLLCRLVKAVKRIFKRSKKD